MWFLLTSYQITNELAVWLLTRVHSSPAFQLHYGSFYLLHTFPTLSQFQWITPQPTLLSLLPPVAPVAFSDQDPAPYTQSRSTYLFLLAPAPPPVGTVVRNLHQLPPSYEVYIKSPTYYKQHGKNSLAPCWLGSAKPQLILKNIIAQ